MNATSRLSRSSFRYQHRAFAPLCLGQRRGQFRPAIKRIGPLAGLDLDPLGHDLEAFGLANR